MTAEASATIVDVGVTLSAANLATADGSLTVDAGGTGIRAGAGTETIVNNGPVSATATTRMTQVDVAATFLGLSIVDRGRPTPRRRWMHAPPASTPMAARGGFIGGAGSIGATAQSFVNVTGVRSARRAWTHRCPLFSGPIATVGITADSTASGVRAAAPATTGGAGRAGHAQSSSTAQQQSVDVGVSVQPARADAGLSVVGAGTKADARAGGIESGSRERPAIQRRHDDGRREREVVDRGGAGRWPIWRSIWRRTCRRCR